MGERKLILNAKFLRTGALLLLLVAAIFIKFLYEPSYVGTEEPFDVIENELFVQVPEMRPTVYDPPEEYSEHGIARDLWSAPASNWLNTQRKVASTDLRRVIRPTLAIVPVQGDINAFDPIEKSLMTRLIGARVGLDENSKVVPPDAVIRFFGTNRASYPDDDIQELVAMTRSRKTLLMHAQHDRNGKWELRAALVDDQLEPLKEERVWSNLKYSDEKPPSIALEQIIDEVAEFATGRTIAGKASEHEFVPEEFTFPDSIADLVARSGKTPLHAAAYLQFLAGLHPRGQFNEAREHLCQRSLVELQYVSPNSPYYHYFKARAYTCLGRRPAALAALGKPENLHESALLDFLNGNLTDLRQHVSDTDTSILDFLAWRDLYELEWKYSQQEAYETMDRLSLAHAAWAPFIQRSIQDYDTWASYSIADIKLGLEELLPAPEISLQNSVAKMLVTGEILSELELTRLVWRHVDAIRSAASPDYKSEEVAAYNRSVNDILDLATTIAVANHIGRIEDDLDTRGVPESALAKINEFEPVFSGHPAVTLLEGRALRELSEDDRQGSEKENLTIAYADSLLNGFAWTGTITSEAAMVALDYGALLEKSSYKGPPVVAENNLSRVSRRFFEWPRGPNWFYFIGAYEAAHGGFKQCLAYISTAFWCLKYEIERQQRNAKNPDAVRDELLAANAHRFAGNPQRREYEVEMARATGAAGAEAARLREQIDAGSVDWATFMVLGRLHFRQGEYQKAAEAWHSYPGFQPGTNVDRLTIGNKANLAGAILYWIGQHELATPFLEIAANSSTGSGAQMESAQRIALIDGDLETAARWSAERVRRYNNRYGFRDLTQILHILDQSDLAWSLFDEFQGTTQNSPMWSGALVGHQVNSASIEDIAEWISASDTRRTAVETIQYGRSIDLAPRYILLAGTMDRVPGPEFVNLVADAHSRPKPQYYQRSGYSESMRARVTSAARHRQHDDLIPYPRDERKYASGETVENRYTMIAAAMTAFLGGDLEAAYEKFNETAYVYLLDEYLPYHVFSAAVTGRTEHLSAALAERESSLEEIRQKENPGNSGSGYRFDEDLSYAVLAAFDDDHDGAIRYLKKALNNRPYLNDRSIFPLYQIADLADRLYEYSGEDVYREFALELSRRHTVVLPMYAWAYYIVAKYSPSAVERGNAAASGIRLDPLSHRGESLPDEVRARALELLDKSEAPYLTRSETPRSETT